MIRSSLTLLLILTFSYSWSQRIDASNSPTAIAIPIEAELTLDGAVLDDPIWQSITPITSLTQLKPDNGQPVSEKTAVRIAYTPKTFYVSVVCYDKEPGKLVVSDARRDASLDDTDSFLFILDTYHDGQNGFVFGTNSIGQQYDGQVDNEGEGNFSQNRQQGRVIGGFNLNWDAVWEVEAEVGDYGWSAEFAIPLRTLRFNSGEGQTWGLNLQRNIRKNNEESYWAPLPLSFDIKRLSLAGTLAGLNLTNQGNLKVIPYVLGRASKDFDAAEPKTEYDAEIGGDIKYSITPNMTLDLTYNTDFAQVEVDNEQVNLDRFNLFFPEKRPFFLENAGQFTVGSPGEVDLFFSRRIGLDENGDVVPIIGGGRLSGKLNNTNVGFLSMFTEDVMTSEVAIEKNNFSVVRVNHQFAQRSSIGGAFTSRQGLGGLPEGISPTNPNEYNRTYALNGRWGIGKKAQITGYYAKSQTPGLNDRDNSFKFDANYRWNGWILSAGYTEVAENFNPEMGFLLRTAYRKPEFLIFYAKRAKEGNKLGLLEVRPHASYRGYWNLNGFQETGRLHVDNHWVWRNGFEVHTGVNFTTEGVLEDFEISEGVIVNPGTYDHAEAAVVIRTNKSKNVYIDTRHILGGSFGGTRFINSGLVGVRLGDKFNSEYSIQQNNFDLQNGAFSATVFGARLSYSFTPRILAQALVQYNSEEDRVSANIRFSLLEQANTGLFVVYNAIRNPREIGARDFTIKYTRIFDVIK